MASQARGVAAGLAIGYPIPVKRPYFMAFITSGGQANGNLYNKFADIF
jgi:hypothetical protein